VAAKLALTGIVSETATTALVASAMRIGVEWRESRFGIVPDVAIARTPSSSGGSWPCPYKSVPRPAARPLFSNLPGLIRAKRAFPALA
jgi:hypothetical protein